MCTTPYLVHKRTEHFVMRDTLTLIRRSARSTLYISPENLRISKWSYSGKNSFKRPMLLISMAYNVISCKKNQKKHSKNQNRWFYYEMSENGEPMAKILPSCRQWQEGQISPLMIVLELVFFSFLFSRNYGHFSWVRRYVWFSRYKVTMHTSR